MPTKELPNLAHPPEFNIVYQRETRGEKERERELQGKGENKGLKENRAGGEGGRRKGVSGGRKEEMNAAPVPSHCLKQGLGKQEVQLRSPSLSLCLFHSFF